LKKLLLASTSFNSLAFEANDALAEFKTVKLEFRNTMLHAALQKRQKERTQIDLMVIKRFAVIQGFKNIKAKAYIAVSSKQYSGELIKVIRLGTDIVVLRHLLQVMLLQAGLTLFNKHESLLTGIGTPDIPESLDKQCPPERICEIQSGIAI
tara:strand:- start:271 stop:726 length:456 start_codon:yes stop_codon:yes gene_type:complete